MTYKVCILAAGRGTRVTLPETTNKALLPVGEKSAFSHILEKFPVDTEIVIALGYRGELLREFVSLAHPERSITFVEVDEYEGPGTGPGYSLNACKEQLQCSFIFTSCDTVVLEDVHPPTRNGHVPSSGVRVRHPVDVV